MSESKLGKLAEADAQRDAMHVAVIPAIAASDMTPGAAVRIQEGYAIVGGNVVGIADPFLKQIKQGQRFYVVIYPNKVTNLRHDWDHDMIPRDNGENEMHDDYDDGCRGC